MLSSHDRIALVHAVFGSMAGLIVIPAGVLAARYGRANPGWWRTHALLNAVGALLIVLTFALGMASVKTADDGTQFSGDEADVHHKLGLAVFIVLLCQCLFGLVAHYVFGAKATTTQTSIAAAPSSDTTHEKAVVDENASAFSPTVFSRRALIVRYGHITFGIVTAGLLYWCVWNGMHTEWASMSEDHSVTPESVQVLFWVCVLVAVFAYVLRAGSDILSTVEYKRSAAVALV